MKDVHPRVQGRGGSSGGQLGDDRAGRCVVVADYGRRIHTPTEASLVINSFDTTSGVAKDSSGSYRIGAVFRK